MSDGVLLSSLVRCGWRWWSDVLIVSDLLWSCPVAGCETVRPPAPSPHHSRVLSHGDWGLEVLATLCLLSARHRLMLGRRLCSLYRGRVGSQPPLHHSWAGGPPPSLWSDSGDLQTSDISSHSHDHNYNYNYNYIIQCSNMEQLGSNKITSSIKTVGISRDTHVGGCKYRQSTWF